MLLSAKEKQCRKVIDFWCHAVRNNGFRTKNRKNKFFFAPAPPFCKTARITEEFAPLLAAPLFRVSCPILHLALLSENDESWTRYQGIQDGAYLYYTLQSQSPTDPHLHAYVGMDCNPTAQGTHGILQQQQNESTPIPKMPKSAIFFWRKGRHKNGCRKKIAKIKHFLPILDAVAKILLIISRKKKRIP